MKYDEIVKLISVYTRSTRSITVPAGGAPVKVTREWFATHGLRKTYTKGNSVKPLVDGEEAFSEIYYAIKNAKNYVLITAWMIEADFELIRPYIKYKDTRKEHVPSMVGRDGHPFEEDSGEKGLSELISIVTGLGVQFRVLIWDRKPLHAVEKGLIYNQWIEMIKCGNGLCYPFLYSAPQVTSSLHQKTIIVDGKVGFCGGLDMTSGIEGSGLPGDRWDTLEHKKDDIRRRIGGATPYWHDVHLRVEGPVVEDMQENFIRRWKYMTGNWGDLKIQRWSTGTRKANGKVMAQVVRTIPNNSQYEEADLSTLETYAKAIINARQYIYIENQYFSCEELTNIIEESLSKNRSLYLIVMLPRTIEFPMSGWPANAVDGLDPKDAIRRLVKAASQNSKEGQCRAFFGYPKNSNGEDIYIHAKIMLVDDVYAVVGSANFSDRSMFKKDEELGVAWYEPEGSSVSSFRERLWGEHLSKRPEELRGRNGRELIEHWNNHGARVGNWLKANKI